MVSGFQNIIDAVFTPIFGWMLNIPPIVAIITLAVTLGLISTLLQKYLTNQAKMRRLRDDTKKYQEQMKKLKKDPEQMMKVQQKILPIQMELMKESFKPLLVSMIPFLLVFFWLSNHFAFHQIEPNEPFAISATFEEGVQGNVELSATPELAIEKPQQQIQDGKASWIARGTAGTYDLTLTFRDSTVIAPAKRPLIISEERLYETPQMPAPNGHKFVTSFNVENQRLIPIPGLNLFGWHPGWIFYYIIFSIPISLLLKKLLKVV
jgi:uncharacterized membrane protein (DUF106 family)